ncbi:MAG: hypothetical protein U0670_05825 [Anaerolineae bacterium]
MNPPENARRIRSRTGGAIVIGLFVLALAIRLYYAHGFDGLYGQDAYAYYNCAAEIVRGTPISPFYWGIGYPTLLAAGFTVFGLSPAVSQAISLILGAALAPMLFALARALGLTVGVSLLAGLLIAISGQAIQSSIVTMADIPALFAAVASALCLLHYTRTDRRVWLMCAVGLLVYAGITRWLYFALVPAWAVLVLMHWRRIRWITSLYAALVAGLVLLPQIAFGLVHPTPVIDHAWVQGWSPANALRRDFVNVDGEFHYASINAVFYAAPLIDYLYLAPYFAPFIVIGGIGRWRRSPVLVWLGLWVALPYAFLIGIPYQNIRFPLIVLPAVILLAVSGVDVAAGVLRRWWIEAASQRRRFFARALTIGTASIVAMSLVGMLGYGSLVIRSFVAAQESDKTAIAWAQSMIPADATIYTLGLTLPLRLTHPDGDVRELYYETQEMLETVRTRDQTEGHTTYLLVNLWQITHQWAGRSPANAFEWLRLHRGLIEVGRQGNIILFQVQP